MKLKAGDRAVDFCLPDADENEVCLKHFSGRWIVLYFYPKDNTPGCTMEAISFSKQMEAFGEKEAVILGLSPDAPQSHCRFRDKHDLRITLLSDVNHRVLEAYGVWVQKKMYGRSYFGVERSTFLIDAEGRVAE